MDKSSKFSRQATVTDGCVSSKNSDKDAMLPKQQHYIVGPSIDAPEYDMNYKYRGRAIIFNDDNGRPGTGRDVEKLDSTFKALEFKVEIFHNLTKHALISYLNEVSKDKWNKDADCLVVIVLAHGEDGYINASDTKFETKELWKPFYADVCPYLAGKPKLFFIQACRGKGVDDGVKIHARRIATDGVGKQPVYRIPKASDILVAYATPSGYYAWRSPNEGSWYIQSLCQELLINGQTHDILKILTNVNRRVAIQYQSTSRDQDMNMKKQIPSFHSTLMREVYFRPKETDRSRPTNQIRESVI